MFVESSFSSSSVRSFTVNPTPSFASNVGKYPYTSEYIGSHTVFCGSLENIADEPLRVGLVRLDHVQSGLLINLLWIHDGVFIIVPSAFLVPESYSLMTFDWRS